MGIQGHVTMGESFTGKLYYPINNKRACEDLKVMDFRSNPLEFIGDEDNYDSVPEKLPILLIDDGGCSNALKSKNAEDFGFRATIIALNDSNFRKAVASEIAYGDEKSFDQEDRELIHQRRIPEFLI